MNKEKVKVYIEPFHALVCMRVSVDSVIVLIHVFKSGL